MFPRPRATALQRTASHSENSHSSESAAPSNSSSNTSWATHYLSNAPSAFHHLPKGAAPPQPSPPVFQHEIPVSSPSTSPNAKRKSRVLRKALPPSSDSESTSSSGFKRWMSFRSSPRSRPPSRSPSRVRVNLDDEPPITSGSTRHHSLPALRASALPPPSAYGLGRKSRSPPRRPRSRSPGKARTASPARARSLTGHILYASEPAARPPDVLDRLRAEIPRVGVGPNSVKIKAREPPSIATPPFVQRNKPLPMPPPPSAPASPTTSYSHPHHLPPRPPILFRHSSYAAPSEEEQEEEAESQFGHFTSGPSAMASASTPGLAYEHGYPYTPRVSWSDVGHAHIPQQWSDSEDTRSDAHPHVQASEAHHHQHQRLRPRYPRSSSASLTALHTRPGSSTRPAPTDSTRSAPLYTTRPPFIEPQPAAAASTSRLSLGKRIKRTLSISLSSLADSDKRRSAEFSYASSCAHSYAESEPRQARVYSYSDAGHGEGRSALPRAGSTSSSALTWSQHYSDDPHAKEPRPPRKLKKRAPSFPSSLALRSRSVSTSALTSASASGLSELLHTPGESEPESARKPAHRKKSRASYPRAETPPPVPPLPDAYSPTPTGHFSTPEPLSQTPSPLPALRPTVVRRLTKRRPPKKKAESPGKGAGAESVDVGVLPLVRTVSPLNLDARGPHFSHASRSHSTPNLGPMASGYASQPAGPRFLPFMTESPPSSPQQERYSEALHDDPAPAPERPSFLRSQSNRRWTLAVSEVPDEQLVEELERLRSVGWGLGFQGELVRVKGGGGGVESPGAKWEKEEDEGWLVARRALMVCREIVRTERSYREGMVRLQRGGTRKAPPPLLLQYLPALIEASEAFNARLDDDPSAWGVSAAFIGVEDTLEVALVAWSGVVGEFFTTNKGKQRRQWSTGPSTSAADKQLEKERKEREKERKAGTGAPVLPPVGSSEDGHAQPTTYIATKSAPSSWRMSMPALSQLLTSGAETPPGEARKPAGSSGSAKTPTVQDLAIQPTQRVMRYVLLYKDLLNSTPITSPARPLVERALEGATRVALRCDRAQGNAAFLT